MRKVLFILICFSLLAVSCKKDDDFEVNNPEVVGDFPPLVFAEDSYWIYQLFGDTLQDSVYVKSIRLDTFATDPENPQSPGTQIPFYYVTYESSVRGTYNESIFKTCTYLGWRNDAAIFVNSKKVGDSCANAKVEAAKEVEPIEYDIYGGVRIIEVNPYRNIRNGMRIYYADNVGVIRKYIYQDSLNFDAWVLLRSDVEAY